MPNPYSFTSPIRYFKANDPNFYEVDNIPLRQLEENILHVKNTIEGGSGGSVGGEISLSQIRDLKAKPAGGMFVKVNPGKFIARINSINKRDNILSLIDAVYTPPTEGESLPIISEAVATSVYTELSASFVNSTAVGYGFNGLESINAFFMHKYHFSHNLDTANPEDGVPVYPNEIGLTNRYGYPVLTSNGFQNLVTGWTNTHLNMQETHRNFVQHWGGVFRTSVVCIDQERTIEIPLISNNELFFEDENSNIAGQQIPVTQRIDLLFAYAVPVDAVSATVAEYTGAPSTPRVLMRPEIGIIRGAGIGFKAITPLPPTAKTKGRVSNGLPKILMHPGDKESPLLGIYNKINERIRGSFPSPDDLINLAPATIINGTYNGTNNPSIGQTAIPIAYIVVKNTTTTISENDIIDIRPFLRTTELTYNERAGIAAASPPLSFANTAVGTIELNDAIDRLRDELVSPVTIGGTSFKSTTYLDTPISIVNLVYTSPTETSEIFGGQLALYTTTQFTNENLFKDIDLAQFPVGNTTHLPEDVKCILLEVLIYNRGGAGNHHGPVVLLGTGLGEVNASSVLCVKAQRISANNHSGVGTANRLTVFATIPITNRRLSIAIPRYSYDAHWPVTGGNSDTGLLPATAGHIVTHDQLNGLAIRVLGYTV